MPVLHPFDHLFIYQFFAPTLLRVVVGVVLLKLAYAHYTHRHAIADVKFMFVGKGMWIAWTMIALKVLVALALITGSYTQPAALLGALLMLKNWVWVHKYPTLFLLTSRESVLMFFILLSLMMTGAGAFAFDLHL